MRNYKLFFWNTYSLWGILKGLEGNVGLEILVNLLLDLSEVLVDILVSSLELLLGEFGHLSRHHALLVLEEAVRSSEEAIESNYFLEESELGVSLVLGFGRLLRLDSLLDGRVDLGVDLLCWESRETRLEGSFFSRLGEGRWDQRSEFLNMSLSINLGGFNSVLLLNSEHEPDRDHVLGKLKSSSLFSFHS